MLSDNLLSPLLDVRDGVRVMLENGELLSIISQVLVAVKRPPPIPSPLAGPCSSIPRIVENSARGSSAHCHLRRRHPASQIYYAGLFRVVKQDTQLGVYPIPKGARVMLCYAAANRDGAKFAALHRTGWTGAAETPPRIRRWAPALITAIDLSWPATSCGRRVRGDSCAHERPGLSVGPQLLPASSASVPVRAEGTVDHFRQNQQGSAS